MRYALDNGAWGCFQREEPFNSKAFEEMLEWIGSGADWIVVPDIVQGGLQSLRFSEKWLSRVSDFGPCLLAVQDGMVPDDVRSLVSPSLGVFLGGSTEWKLRTMEKWGELAREKGAWFHVARVNTVRRIRLCQWSKADSFDGSSVSRFSCTLRRLDLARRQESLFP